MGDFIRIRRELMTNLPMLEIGRVRFALVRGWRFGFSNLRAYGNRYLRIGYLDVVIFGKRERR